MATTRAQAAGWHDRAFTLVEMLLVIGLLMTLMGLTVGAIATTRNRDKLLVAEHLVTDLIRQARHTARSGGAPVTLFLSKADRTLSGAVRVPAFGTDFEGSSTFPGVTGDALVFDAATGAQTFDLESKDRIDRPGNRGFYLSCLIRLPAVNASQPIIPLVAVGTSPTITDMVCGLALEAHEVELQNYDHDSFDPPNPPLNPQNRLARTSQFEVVAWVKDSSGLSQELLSLEINDALIPEGSVDDLVRPEESHVTVPPAPPHGYDYANALVGQQWIHLGLLFDGTTLTLLRDGRRLRHLAVSGLDTSGFSDGPARVYVGGFDTITAQGSGLVIDNVRLERIAASRPATLPSRVTTQQDHRITAYPEGRLEIDGTAGGTIVVQDDGGRTATITISATGDITSEITGAP